MNTGVHPVARCLTRCSPWIGAMKLYRALIVGDKRCGRPFTALEHRHHWKPVPAGVAAAGESSDTAGGGWGIEEKT